MKILLIRMSSIGDIVITTPVIRALREKYPNSTIDYVVFDIFKDSILGNKCIDNIIIFEKSKYKGIKGVKEFCKNLDTYDLIIDMHGKPRSALIALFTKGKVITCKKRPLWQSLLVKFKLIKYVVKSSTVENYFKSLKKIGLEYKGENLEFDYSETDLSRIAEYKNEIVFAPGASKDNKKWSKDRFAHLGKLLSKEYNKKVILVGSKGEREELEYIRKNIGENCENLAGKLSLKESGALMAKAFFVVANDSGPFHIARATGVKTFVFFGPTNPKLFRFKENVELFYTNEPCSSCSFYGDDVCPKGHLNCLKNIEVDNVFDRIKNRVKSKEDKCQNLNV